MTVAAKIYLEKADVVSPTRKFIIDSGGHTGQGLSIYVQDGVVVAEVAESEKMWKVLI